MKNIFKLILCIIWLFSFEYAQASSEDRKKIDSLGLFKNEDLVVLNKHLYGEDILNHFEIRKRLLSLSYEELSKISQQIKAVDSMAQLNNLLEEILSKMEKESIYLLIEENYVNNTPELLDFPFYNNANQNFKITDLKPYAERLYFNNLKLEYKRNYLKAKTDKLWINPKFPKEDNKLKKQNNLSDKINYWQADRLLYKTEKVWGYDLRSDNLTNFVVMPIMSDRQMIKIYEENPIFPVSYKGMVILRNEYRLFCVDILTGREIWSYSPDKKGYEFYQTLRHPHHNTYGYEMLLEKNIVYTELAGKLVAIKIEDIHPLSLLWEKDLGEYSVCIKPVKYENSLIVGLINAREELWICGFNSNNGSLQWNTYVGTTSFLSPACVTSAIKDNKIILGTNHGILVCLEPSSGEIIWLREYTPKKLSLFDYFMKGESKAKWLDKGFIKFDTQFINIDNDGTLYYKPRESDYLYLLDFKTGEIIEEILIDSDRYYLLKAANDKIVLLEKTNGKEKVQLKVIHLKSGNQIYATTLDGGVLKGVVQLDKEEILFKVGEIIHFLRVCSDSAEYSKTEASLEGWLLSYNNEFLLTGENRTLYCWASPNREYTIDANNQALNELFKKRDRIRHNLTLSDIKSSGISANEMAHIIVNDLEKMRGSPWDSSFPELKKLYGNEIITYRDIEIKFSNFLYELGLTEPDKKNDKLPIIGNYFRDIEIKFSNFLYELGLTEPDKKNDKLPIKGNPKNKNYEVKGDRIRLLPIDVIDGPQSLNFFLVLNFDQLFCVNEEGKILWDRRIFYLEKNLIMDPLGARGPSAYLYKNILIINDGINIIAVNVNDGRLIWSMTNKEVTDKSKFFNHDNRIEFQLEFFNDKIIILHGQNIYSVNPITGYCERFNKLGFEGTNKILISNGCIYILSGSLKNIKVLNKDFVALRNFSLDFTEDKKKNYDLIIMDDNIVLLAPPYLYLFNKFNGGLKGKINMGNFNECYIENYNNNLFAIIPFKKLINFNLHNNSLSINWEMSFETEDLDTYLLKRIKGRHYFLVDKNIIFPIRREGNYYFVSVDSESGKKLWEICLKDMKGIFLDLSPYIKVNNLIYFIFTTGLENATEETVFNKDILQKAGVLNTVPGLFTLNVNNGKIVMDKIFPGRNRVGFQRGIVTHTQNYVVSVGNDNLLRVERK